MPHIVRPLSVDLFGGGGAISMFLASRGQFVLYNELNPVTAEAFARAVRGDYEIPPLEYWGDRESKKDHIKKDVIANFLLAYIPGNDRHSVSGGYDYSRKCKRICRVTEMACADRIFIVNGDYSALSQLKKNPFVAWYIDPPYRNTEGYAAMETGSVWSWSWCDDIVGPIVGFDSYTPEGFDEVFVKCQERSHACRKYYTYCFYRAAHDKASGDDFQTAKQQDFFLT